MKTLLLWDIDGTLIDSGGAGERALRVALEREFGIVDTLAWLDWAGRTDLWIARAILRHHGLSEDDTTATRYLDGYVAAVSEEMANPRARILPGVERILAHVATHPGMAQGLLTGNLERGAKIKLGHFDLWRYFAFGAFADDHESRNELGPHALRRAAAHHRIPFAPDRTFVIGDTPHDIACGRAIGARTLAVATGKYSVDALKPFHATFVLPDLQDFDAVMHLLESQ
ncbi:hydrolase [Opitutaceae bacterium EW11]|nr:hydrolase [Opitutaceae bacterium EW11]